ncbi:MAG: GNAT family N-acetyltransferase [Planctomycetota bacterium]|jgi:GNAT superfamily N-acetyltransferase
MEIRPYRPADLEACRELWRALTQHHRDIYDDQSIGGADPGIHFDKYLAHPKLVGAWVAEEAGAVVGLTGLLGDGDEAEIEPVVVSAAHRARGIGRGLIERMLAEARARRARSVSIRPVARNALAIRRFHAAGFRTLGHIEMFQKLGPSEQAWKPDIDLHGREFRY